MATPVFSKLTQTVSDDIKGEVQPLVDEANLTLSIIQNLLPGAMYDTTTDGVNPTTGVAAGQFFVTWQDNRLRIYLNNNGTAILKSELSTTAQNDSLYTKISDLISPVDGKGTALVGFLPAGAGAVGRTVQSKARELVSILDFGAIGDGVTDNTAAFTAAIASGMRTFFVPAGTYVHGPISISSNVSFIGITGPGGTSGGYPILKLKNSSTGDQFTVSDTGTLTFEFISLDGNSVNQSNPRSAIVCQSAGSNYRLSVKLRNTLIRDYTGYGLYLGLNRNAAKISQGTLISGCQLGCLYSDGAQDIQAVDAEFSQSALAPVITIASSAGASASHLFIGCRAYYGGHAYGTLNIVTPGTPGVLISGANNRSFTWLGGQINAMTGEAVRITATETISSQSLKFIDVEYNGNSKGASGAYSNIYTTTRYVRFSGHYADYAGVSPVKYILEVASALANVAMDCQVGAESTGYTLGFSNGTVNRLFLDKSYGQRITFSASVQNVVLDIGQTHLEVNANGESVSIRSKVCHETPGYTLDISIIGVGSGKSVTLSKATGGANITFSQSGLFRCAFIANGWTATRIGDAQTSAVDTGTNGLEFYSSSTGTISVPSVAKVINITSATGTVTLTMPAAREIGGESVLLIVRGYSSTISVAKSSGSVTSTAVTSVGLWKLIFTQGTWKASLLGDVPA